MKYCGIGHEKIRSYRDKSLKYVIYTGSYKVENHSCGVTGCNKGKGKICVHITAKCANCGKTHTANFPRCVSRHKTNIKTRKKKKTKEKM